MKITFLKRSVNKILLAAVGAALVSTSAYCADTASQDEEEMPNMTRTWKTIVNDKEFSVEATAVRLSNEKLTLQRKDNKQNVQVALDILSDDDKEWLKENGDYVGKTPAEIKAMAASPIAKELKGKTKGLVGEKWTSKEPKKTAKFFIVYYSASWCPPCRAGAPHSVSVYNEQISKLPGLEVVMCNLDQTEDAAKAWATKEQMPWPMLVGPQAMIAEFKKIAPRGIPNMKLVDGNGELIAEGSMETLVAAAKEKMKPADKKEAK